jgi:hypothetical protein
MLLSCREAGSDSWQHSYNQIAYGGVQTVEEAPAQPVQVVRRTGMMYPLLVSHLYDCVVTLGDYCLNRARQYNQ